MDIKDLKDKYQRNPEFHSLVSVVENFMLSSRFTPQDIRDAAFIAGLRIHEREFQNSLFKVDDSPFYNKEEINQV